MLRRHALAGLRSLLLEGGRTLKRAAAAHIGLLPLFQWR